MATMDGERCFVDTNVLVYATQPDSPWHSSALDALNAARARGDGLVVSTQILREYLVAATRPDESGRPVDVSGALDNLRVFAREFIVLEDTRAVMDRLTTIVGRYDVHGKVVHDANIVATMLTNDIRRLLTHNTGDFARFSDVIAVVSLA